jgi:hypothetical protein
MKYLSVANRFDSVNVHKALWTARVHVYLCGLKNVRVFVQSSRIVLRYGDTNDMTTPSREVLYKPCSTILPHCREKTNHTPNAQNLREFQENRVNCREGKTPSEF